MADDFDGLVLGARIRHARRRAGATLADVSERVGRPAPYLSQLENGKVEPKLSLLGDLAAAIGTTTADLLDPNPPDRRAELEIGVARAQEDPRYAALGLPYLKPSAKLGDDVLEHILTLWQRLADRDQEARTDDRSRFADHARAANMALREEMRRRDNYFVEIEDVARLALDKAGYGGSGPISERVLTEIAAGQGFTIERVSAMPRTARSITDTRDRIIFIPDRGGLRIRQARSVVLQTLGHFALEHRDTTDFGEYLRQRIESNYFAAAVLAPEAPAVDFLREAKSQNDISVEDLKEVFYISYEMAAHRFTNLATRHLDIPCHFLRTDSEGVISKAYENDGIRFPAATDGGLEGQRVPRQWGSRQAWNAHGSFLLHSQFTVCDEGDYFCTTYIETETDRTPHAISLGTTAAHASAFRGADTLRREFARGREIEPDPQLVEAWEDVAWPSAAERSHVLSALPPSDRQFSPFPGIDLLDVYRFLERQRRGRQ
ncbi:MAG: helix-turn-helix domain-containing protein [Acidimicrobiales bacterium]|nr:helix-turn-helix domain-containing protein [Acidimicrobiales bacterium]